MSEILVVDDERLMRKNLELILKAEGFSVELANNGRDAVRKVSEHLPDLVLLDVMMPIMNGFVACEEIRKINTLLPIIFLTAFDGDAEQVRGYGVGADGYLSKTDSKTVLVAAIKRALLRVTSYNKTHPDSSNLKIGREAINLNSRRIIHANGTSEMFTATECDILRLLSDTRGKVFTHEEIVAVIRGEGFAISRSTVRSHISNLRFKLREAGNLIVANSAGGYRLI